MSTDTAPTTASITGPAGADALHHSDPFRLTHDYLAREAGARGEFRPQENRFTTPFGTGEGQLPVEAGRYRLIAALVCPYAHRQLIVREVLGLQAEISVGVVDPIRGEDGWEFNLDPGQVDPVLGIHTLGEAYLAGDPDFTGRYTVPAVVDIESGAVVNNDHPVLSNYFEVQWRELQAPDAPDLYPADLRAQIDELNQFVYDRINTGVYKCGFARTQEVYVEAYHQLFEALDQMEERLATRRFLFGDQITDADVRLFPTLVRFDAAYHGAFHCNRQRLVDFPNLWGYARDLFQVPGFGSTTDFEQIKLHYYTNPMARNQFGIVPVGPDESGWHTDPGRRHLSSQPDVIFRAHDDERSRAASTTTRTEEQA